MTDSLTDNFKSRDASASKNHTDITKTHLVPVTPDFAIHLLYLKGVKEMGFILSVLKRPVLSPDAYQYERHVCLYI